MYRIGILYLIVISITNCKDTRGSLTFVSVDTISAKQFLSNKNICDLAIAKNFSEIKPKMVPWATDTNDPYSESYFIGEKN